MIGSLGLRCLHRRGQDDRDRPPKEGRVSSAPGRLRGGAFLSLRRRTFISCGAAENDAADARACNAAGHPCGHEHGS